MRQRGRAFSLAATWVDYRISRKITTTAIPIRHELEVSSDCQEVMSAWYCYTLQFNTGNGMIY